MTDKVKLLKEEIKNLKTKVDDESSYSNGWKQVLRSIEIFIDSLPEELDREGDLKAKSENKNFEEIDRYCTLCMDINCFGCKYHDIHFRDIFKDGTIH